MKLAALWLSVGSADCVWVVGIPYLMLVNRPEGLPRRGASGQQKRDHAASVFRRCELAV